MLGAFLYTVCQGLQYSGHFQLHRQPTALQLPSAARVPTFHHMKSDLCRNFRLAEKCILSSLLLTFSQVDHAILSPLRSLVFYRETDFLPNQLLPKELSGRKCPGLKDKTDVTRELFSFPP